MLFTCLPPGAQIPGRFPGPAARARQVVHGRHPLPCADPQKRREMVPASRPPSPPSARGFANERTREVNRRAGRAQPHPIHLDRKAARRHGPHGDRHPGDLAVAEPDLLRRRRPIWGSRQRGSSTTTSPTSAAATPTASSGSAPCRSRRRIWLSPSSTGCTNRLGFAASRSPPTSPATICRRRRFRPIFARMPRSSA